MYVPDLCGQRGLLVMVGLLKISFDKECDSATSSMQGLQVTLPQQEFRTQNENQECPN